MKKSLKITLIILGVLVGLILLDTLQARVFKHSPIISYREDLTDDSYVNRGLLMDTYYCVQEKDMVNVSWHFKTSKFDCPISNTILESDSSQYTKEIDQTKLELAIPSKWTYEEITPTDEENYTFALKLFKSDMEQNATLYINKQKYSACGTGRTTKTMKLNNGEEVTVGYYGSSWSDISLSNDTNIVFINNGLTDDDAEDFLNIVKTFAVTNEYNKNDGE